MTSTIQQSPVLVAEGLTKTFLPPAGLRRLLMRSPLKEPVSAVTEVNLEVQPGEVFGLLGPNGAGKTTLIKMLTTLLHPTSGHATVAGHDVVRDEAGVRDSVGLVTGDERSFYLRLTGRQNLAFFAALSGLSGSVASRRVDEVLDMMGLAAKADDMYYSYSTGMRQKLGVARAVLNDPRLLFLDEPTRGVDVIAINELKSAIRGRLADDGRAVVLATHRMEEAEELCDRIAIMLHGRVEFCGTVAELRRRAGGRKLVSITVAGMDAAACTKVCITRELKDSSVEIPGDTGLVELKMSVNGEREMLSSVLSDLLAAGGVVIGCNQRERRLEELFIDVVKGGPA